MKFQHIKRKYWLTNKDFARFFGYASANNFRRSYNTYEYLTRAVERIYKIYDTEGLQQARKKALLITWPAESDQDRQENYRDGLYMFLNHIVSRDKSGRVRDPTPYRKK